MVASAATAGSLFFVLWWMLQGEDHPWVPAGLAASVVMLVAASAREVIMRRAWTRYVLEENAAPGVQCVATLGTGECATATFVLANRGATRSGKKV